MPFPIPQKLLNEMLSLACRVGGKQHLVHAAMCAKISFGAGISISATDLDKWITLSTSGFDPEKCETAVVPMRQLASIVASLPKDEEIQLQLINKKRLNVRTNKSNYNFGCVTDEWPSVECKAEKRVDVTAKSLCSAIEFVVPCVYHDVAQKASIAGIGIRTMHGALRFMATDSHRIATHYVQGVARDEIDIILPRDTALLFKDVCDVDGEQTAKLEFSAGKIRLEIASNFGEIVIISRLIDSLFPDIDKIIPYGRKGTSHLVDREELERAVNRASKISESLKGNPITIALGPSEAVVTSGSEADSASEQIQCSGEDRVFKFTVNALYIGQLLKVFDNELLHFYGDPEAELKPIMVGAANEEITDKTPRFYAIAPMRG